MLPLLLSLGLLSWNGQARDTLPPLHVFSFGVDDDFLNVTGHGTDRYYTGGFYIQYSFLAGAGHSKLLRKLLYSPYPAVPSFYTIGITQWVYTPDNLSATGPVIGDYPYCGVLFLRLSRETLSGDRSSLFGSSLSLGTMGPASLGREVQMVIHNLVKDTKPRGWSHQLPDYPVINYALSGQSHLFSLSRFIHVNGSASIQAGTLQDDAQIALHLLASNAGDNFFPNHPQAFFPNHPQATTDPDHPTAGTLHKKKLLCYIAIIPAAKFVAYNSILEGGPFDKRDDYHIPPGQLHRVIFEGTGILGIQTKKLLIQYRQVIESPEFRTVFQHVYGTLAFSITL